MKNKFNYIDGLHNTSQSDIVVPYLIQLFNPKSVLDIGCGLGNWLYSFKKNGVFDVLGFDGDNEFNEIRHKYLEENEYVSYNFENELDINRKFDLVISLEVAEHLSEKYADTFIKSLTNHSDIIVFSAALPGQGGQGHLNEKFLSYWIHKFNVLGYDFFDPIRYQFWDNDELFFWYKQNMVVFSKKKLIFNKESPIDLIHPNLLLMKEEIILDQRNIIAEIRSGNVSVLSALRILVKSILKFFR